MNILFLGTFSPPITGQSLAFEASYFNYKGPKNRIDKTPIGHSSLGKLATHLIVAFKLLYTLLFKKVDKVYMTCFSTIEGSLSDVIVLFLCHFFRKKAIVHLHGSNFRDVIEKTAQPYRWILVQLYRRVDKAIVLSENMREQFDFLLPAGKIEVISNFCDPVLEAIPVNYRESKGLTSNLKIGYLSNLIYSKGIMHVVEAVESLLDEGANIELHVAGKYMGDSYMSENEIRDKFKVKLEARPQIKYYNVVAGEEKLQFYKNIDVFVLPTFYLHEAQPLSIIEAMRAGCVIVSTDYKYIPDLVSPKNGYLVEIDSVDSLCKIFRHILSNSALCKDIQCYNAGIAVKEYSLETHLFKLYSIFAAD